MLLFCFLNHMASTPFTSRFVATVDYLWDRKVRFLIVVAAFFFAIHGISVAVLSFNNPLEPVVQELLPKVEATTTVTVENVVVSSTPTPASTTPIKVAARPVLKPSLKPVTPKPAAVVSTIIQVNLPNRIVISRFAVDVAVSNLKSTNVDVLNDQLTRTVVRYNGSGTMTEGNMLIMGHSSELPIIHNPLYKVFSQLKYLVAGDEIKVYSETGVNTYRVTSVNMLSINDEDAYIPFSSQGSPKLTLVTCNVRGAKDQRYIVNADLVASN